MWRDPALIKVPATRHRRVDKRSAVQQQRRWESVDCAIACPPYDRSFVKAVLPFFLSA